MKWIILVLGFIWYMAIEIFRGRPRRDKFDSVFPLGTIGMVGLLNSVIIALILLMNDD